MKKLTFVATTILALGLTTSNLQAREATTEENVGFFTGALAGAAIGGPIGFIIGGVSGILMGDQVHQANQLEGLEMKISQQNHLNAGLIQELDALQVSIEQTNEMLDAKTQFLTHELTLNLMFQSNSSELADRDFALVDRVSSILTDFPELNIQLDGYTDPVGNPEDNLSLSQDRTSNVKLAFESLGINSRRIQMNSHGESLTSIDIKDMDSYALERRVSINFYIGDNLAELHDNSDSMEQLSSEVVIEEFEEVASEDSDVLAIN
ncbi:MAG: hypothetical protein COB38_02880 [Gammaproteobacteria bacterium]|nr:MAG: hypothetical protein COB38_02880 [Gammaproteobacteria bacterium]